SRSSPDLPFTDATSEWSAADEAPATLATTLGKEMAERWRRGERPLVEEFLSRHPVLWGQPEVAARLIYEEICLREESGEEHPSAEVVQRFPQWQGQLQSLQWRRSTGPEQFFCDLPKVGEEVGGFRLVAELGLGARGRVYLATQADLADRPVVLKIT